MSTKKDLIAIIREKAQSQPVTLLFAAKDQNYNNAVALIEYLKKQ